MTPTRSGSPTGSAGSDADVRARSRATPIRPSELQPVAVPPPVDLQPGTHPESFDAVADPAEPASTAPSPDPAADPNPTLDPPTTVRPPRHEERRALRAARRRRQRLAVACAALVAFCLGVTILIVVMAGNRTPGPQVVTALPAVSAAPSISLDVVPGDAWVRAWGRA
jgi:hypothetical protein